MVASLVSNIIYLRGRLIAQRLLTDRVPSPVLESGNRENQQIHLDFTTLFEYDGRRGPRFKAIHSRTTIHDTGHLASLFMLECAETDGTVIPGRQIQPVFVTVANLDHCPDAQVPARWTQPSACRPVCVPIIVSLITSIMCGLYGDWYSFSAILFGMLANGLACLVIGSATLLFTHPKPEGGSYPGDGILGGEEGVVILKGKEGAVNAVTRGKFSLRFEGKSVHRCVKGVKFCSFLLVAQAIAQLILIPQSALHGQLMFVFSITVSWLYNLWLWSFNRDKVQRHILMNVLHKPILNKFVLGTRASMVVFVLLALGLDDPTTIINDLLPGCDTRVWQKWKTAIVNKLMEGQTLEFDSSENFNQKDSDLDMGEQEMLRTWFTDAMDAYKGFHQLYAPQCTPTPGVSGQMPPLLETSSSDAR